MQVIWAHDEICVREVMQALNGRGAARAYTTYMTIMARLDAKGLLIRTRRGKTDFYRAVYHPRTVRGSSRRRGYRRDRRAIRRGRARSPRPPDRAAGSGPPSIAHAPCRREVTSGTATCSGWRAHWAPAASA